MAETAQTSTVVSPHVTMTAPSASLAILPVSINISLPPILAVTFCCMCIFLDSRFQAVTPTVGFKPVVRQLPDPKLKPKIQGDCYAWTAGYLFSCGFEQFKYPDLN